MNGYQWSMPRTIFVNFVSDLFHEDVPMTFIDEARDIVRVAS